MNNTEIAKKLANTIGAYNLDGDPKLSEVELLAVTNAVEQYEGADFDHLNPQLLEEIDAKVKLYFDLLKGKKPSTSTFYFDFSGVRQFYLDKRLENITGKKFDAFCSQVIDDVSSFFKLSDGKKLNIKFTSNKPTEDKFTTLVFSPVKFSEFLYQKNEYKIRYARYIIDTDSSGEGQRLYEDIKRKNPGYSDEQILLKVADSAFTKKDIPYFGAVTLNRKDSHSPENQFGNRVNEGLIYVNFLDVESRYKISKEVVEGRQAYNLPDKYWEPYLARDPNKNIALAIAQKVAHEIGHSLGLDHPHEFFRMYLRKNGQKEASYPAKEPNIMYDPFEISAGGFTPERGVLYFDPFALEYFKFILGTKSSSRKRTK